MPKKVFVPLFTLLFAFALPMLLAQEGQKNEQEKAPAQAEEAKKAQKRDRWEGVIVRSSPDKSTLTVREVGSTRTRTVRYDNSTRWVSQAHGSNEVNDIDASQGKDGDRVICTGTWEKDGALHYPPVQDVSDVTHRCDGRRGCLIPRIMARPIGSASSPCIRSIRN